MRRSRRSIATWMACWRNAAGWRSSGARRGDVEREARAHARRWDIGRMAVHRARARADRRVLLPARRGGARAQPHRLRYLRRRVELEHALRRVAQLHASAAHAVVLVIAP